MSAVESIPPPSTISCRDCGYDLGGLDFGRAGYRCPECGEINIPNDATVPPIVREPWPNPALMVLGFLWPGAAFAGSIVGACGSSAFLVLPCIVAAIPLAIGIFVWPLILARHLLGSRIPRRFRARRVALCCLIAIPGNLAVAAVLLNAAGRAGLLF